MPGLTREEKQRREEKQKENARQVQMYKEVILGTYELNKDILPNFTIIEQINITGQNIEEAQKEIRKQIQELEAKQNEFWKEFFKLERKREALEQIKQDNRPSNQ
jgi:hypothetical protein